MDRGDYRSVFKGEGLLDNYAGFWIRVGAYLIDFVIFVVVITIVLMIFGESAFETGAANFSMSAQSDSPVLDAVSFVMGLVYFAAFESSKFQGTPGKRAMGLIVTDFDGNRISFLRAVGRYFAKILSALILLIGYIMVGFTERKQGLHDMICSTLVVKATPGETGVDTTVFE